MCRLFALHRLHIHQQIGVALIVLFDTPKVHQVRLPIGMQAGSKCGQAPKAMHRLPMQRVHSLARQEALHFSAVDSLVGMHTARLLQ